jgi:hypothetical protein
MTFFSNRGWLGTGFAIIMFLILSVMIASMGTKIILSSNRSIDAAREKQAYWTSFSGLSFTRQEHKKGQGIIEFGGGKVYFDDLCVIGQSADVLSGGGLITLESNAFVHDDTLSDNHYLLNNVTCLGDNESPALNWSGVPTGAEKLVIIVEDIDANGEIHWALYNLPADNTSLVKDYDAPNGVTELEDYVGPCPPEDGGIHRYVFKIYALNASIGGSPADIAALRTSMEGKIIACGQIIARYERTS